jgi:phage FluMu protein Com
MAIEFRCPNCGRLLSVGSDSAGKQAKCPQCSQIVSVPNASIPPDPAIPPAAVFCPRCGEKNLENNFRCTACGFVLHGASQPQYVVTSDATMGGLIPYKNAQALWAYYLGVFSLIPCAGIPLGVAAVVLGIRGLKYARVHPESKGEVHAWIGVVLGFLCAVCYSLLIIIPLIGAAMNR